MPTANTLPLKPALRPLITRLWFWALIAGIVAVAFALDNLVYEWLHANFNHTTRPVPSLLKIPARILKAMETWGEVLYIGAALVTMWLLDSRHRSRVPILIVTVLVATLVVEGVKRTSGRVRPDVAQGANVWHGIEKMTDGGDYQSFPSGHAASSAGYSGALASFYPPLRPVCIFLAAGCSASRVWKERHFLSDVIVGGFFGFLMGFYFPRSSLMQRFGRWFDRYFSEREQLASEPVDRLRAA